MTHGLEVKAKPRSVKHGSEILNTFPSRHCDKKALFFIFIKFSTKPLFLLAFSFLKVYFLLEFLPMEAIITSF